MLSINNAHGHTHHDPLLLYLLMNYLHIISPREVWPDGEVFGAADIEPEDEFMALREIHFTNLNGEKA